MKKMNKGTVIFAFALGAAAGAAVTWKHMETKYDRLIQEEIDSVKEVYSKREIKEEVTEEEEADEEDPSELPRTSVVDQAKYEEISQKYNHPPFEEEVNDMDEPYVIAPEEFGEEDEYDTESLTYYADGVLTDDADNPIEDVDGMVGVDSLNHFGEYEDDSVFVRNPAYRTDFEILADSRNYSDVVGNVLTDSE